MPDITNLLDQAINAGMAAQSPKQMSVAAASQAKVDTLRAGGYSDGAAQEAGFSGIAGVDPMAGIYDPASIVAHVAGRGEYTQDTSSQRSPGQAVLDTGIDAVGAMLTTPLNIANIPISAIDADAGAVVSQFIEQGLANARSKQSDGLNDRRSAYAARNEVTSAHNRALAEDEKTAGESSIVAEFRRLGRDVLDGFNNMDGAIASSTIGSGLGSLVTAGPIGRGLGALSKGKLGTGTAIGLQEAGGAHVDITNRVLSMSHDELLQGSESYGNYLASGLTPDEARNRVARDAALQAAATVGPAAAIIGKITGAARFESAPLSAGSVRSVAGNVAKETLEESAQSGAGGLLSNVALADQANSEQDLLEGVGEGIAHGAVGGMGAAGVVQTPAAIGRTGQLIGKGIVRATQATLARGERLIREQIKIADDKLDTAVDAAVVTVADPEVRQNVEEAVTTHAADENEAQIGVEYVNKVFDMFSDERIKNMRFAAQVAADPNEDTASRHDAALDLIEMHKELVALGEQTPDSIKTLLEKDRDHPAAQRIAEVLALATNIGGHTANEAAIESALATQSETDADAETSPATMKPLAHRDAQRVARLAKHRPELVDPVQLELALQSPEMTAEEQRALNGARALVQAVTAQKDHAKRLGLKSADDVSREIRMGSNDPGVKDLSLTGYLRDINSALEANNEEQARSKLQDLMGFAKHLQNKVGAINKALALGGGTAPERQAQYWARDPRTGKPYKAKWGITPTSINGVRINQMIANDMEAVVTLANNLARVHPQLGVKELPVVSLDERLNGKADEVAYRFQQLEKGVDIDTKPTTRAPEAAETAQPKGGDKSAKTEVKTETEAAPAEPQAKQDEPKVEVEPKVETTPEVVEKKEETSEKAPAETRQEQLNREAKERVLTLEENAERHKLNGNSIREAYPNLVENKEAGVINWFTRSFKFPEGQRSRLVALADPIVSLLEAMRSQETAEKFTGKPLKKTINSKVRKGFNALLNYSNTIADAMHDNLVAVLQKEIAKGAPTFGEALINGNPDGKKANTFARTKQLNLVDNVDGNLQYNPELMQGAILAGLNWLMTSAKQGRLYKDDEIAEILGMDVSSVRPEHRSFFQNGTYLLGGVESLTANIMRFWGIAPNGQQPIGESRAIIEAMAKEVLLGLEAAKLIEFGELTIGTDEKPKTFRNIQVKVPDQIREDVRGFPDALEQMISVEPHEELIIGEPSTRVDEYQDRARLRKLPKQQIEAQREAQKTPLFLNMPMVNLLFAFGEKAALELFGHGDLSQRELNINHRGSLEGFNRTITGAFEHIKDLVAQVGSAAERAGVEIDQMPTFLEYRFATVNRLFAQGKYNPQSNKLVREAQLSTRSTLDLSNENGKHFDLFMLAIAQHLGEKVHKQRRAVSLKNVQTELAKREQSIKVLQQFLKNGGDLGIHIDTFKAEMGDQIAPAEMHSLLEYARWLNASTEERKSFTTSLYVEADGVTDGPINAMMHLSTGMFTPHWLKVIAKGGLFIGEQVKTLAQWIAQGGPAAVDLYEATTMLTRAELIKKFESGWGSDAVNQQFLQVLSLLDQLLGDDFTFKMDDDGKGVLEIKRGVAKNPLTVIVYGSGNRGIANKITGEIINELYVRMSEGKLTPELGALLSNLTNSRVWSNKKKKGLLEVQQRAVNYSANRLDYTFRPNQIENLRDNILHLFVTPLKEGIDQAIGEVNTGKDLLRAAEQVKSLFIKKEFETEIQKLLADREAKDPEWEKHRFVSQADLDEITRKVAKKFDAVVRTPTQTFYTAGNDFAGVPNGEGGTQRIEMSRTLNNKLGTDMQISAPANARVRGISHIIQGSGDGQMIQNIIVDIAPKGAFYVFDGVNLPLDTAEEVSVGINESVLKGWLNNPLAAVSESFANFMQQANGHDFDESSPEFAELVEAIFGFEADPKKIGQQDVQLGLEKIRDQLKEAALTNQARKNVLAKVQLSVDHMASLESPYSTEGKIVLEGTPEEISAELNKLYFEELRKLRGEPKAEAPAASEQAEAQSKMPMVLTASRMLERLSIIRMSRDQRIVARSALRSLGKNSNFVVGSRDEIRNYLAANGLTVSEEMLAEDVNGFFQPDHNTTYIVNENGEVITHELVHAATYAKLFAAYNGREDLITDEDQAAINRLDELMQDWLAETPPSAARRQVEADLAAGNRAGAVNEFMAWVLGNKELTEAAKKQKASKVALIKTKIMNALKKLLGIKVAVSDDVFTNLRFNTMVLIKTPAHPSLYEQLMETALQHNTSYGTDQRLRDLQVKFASRVAAWIKSGSNPAVQTVLKQRMRVAVDKSLDVASIFRTSGFRMSGQEASAFKTIVMTLATEAELNPNALARVQDLYDHVVKNLTVEHFMTDPDDDTQRPLAQEKFNAVIGRSGSITDLQGRSSLLPAFVGLATTNEQFRNILAGLALPKAKQNDGRSLDELVENFGSESMDALSRLVSGEGRNAGNVLAAMDVLSLKIAEQNDDDKKLLSQIEAPVGNALNRLNTTIVDFKDEWSEKAVNKLKEVEANTNRKIIRDLARFGQVIAASVNEDRAQEVAKGLMSMLNEGKVNKTIHEFVNEMVGRTTENASIYDLIKPVRALVQQARQQFREYMPKQIEGKFSRKLTKDEWTHLYKGLAVTDLAVLRDGANINQILRLLKNQSQITAEVSKHEDRLSNRDPVNWPKWQQKAKELAEYMVNDTKPENLLRNAFAIANLYGELGPRQSVTVTNATIQEIDQLVSLYAFELLPQATKDTLASLTQTEETGITFVLSKLRGLRMDEQSKVAGSQAAQINHFKGHVHTENTPGVTLRVADDREEGRLNLVGFKRIADYRGSTAERGAHRRGYYFAPLSGRAPYNQGIMQNVRATASGVDPITGFSIGLATAGVITDPYEVEQIRRNRRFNTNSDEALLPVYGDDGAVIAWERALSAEHKARLDPNTQLAEVIGIWSGRMIEEKNAQDANMGLIQALAEKWQEEGNEKEAEYIDVFDLREQKKDPVLADAVRLITPQAREYINSLFPDGRFMIRKDMVNDALGYRGASIGDAWTGVSRTNPEVAKNIRRFTVSIFGVDAYKNLVTAEKFWQNFVADARTTIIVKSVVVPVANMISNIYHLTARGVPMTDIFRGISRKTAEINAYTKGRLRKMELDSLLDVAVVENDTIAQNKLRSEIRAIEDSWTRLSIWPLLKAGEFSSISDAGISQDETLLMEGKLHAYIEKMVDKLPDEVRTAGRYAIISKDTALFQGLQKAVSYGDFLGKAILYDDIIKRQKKDHAYALGRISEEFVNYDRLAGRTRSYLENSGLIWFWNFKVRAVKIALATIRNNPLHALLVGMAPTPDIVGSIGSPVSDNLFAVAADGRLEWSIGPGQGFRAYELNPWWQLFG